MTLHKRTRSPNDRRRGEQRKWGGSGWTRRAWLPLLVLVGLVAFTVGSSGGADAQTAPSLGTASSFGVLGGSTVTNTGSTTVNGNVGVSPGSAITGFPPGTLTGTLHANDGVAQQAQLDSAAAFGALDQACDATLTGEDLGGMTLTGGVYCFAASAQLTGALTLDGEGTVDAVFIFRMGTTLTTASNASVLFVNGAQACNVFWRVGSSAVLGTGTSFSGNILALASITLDTGASVDGRALAQTGAITMDTNDVSPSACVDPTPVPTGTTISPSSTAVTPATATAIAQATATAIAEATLTPVTPPTATAIAQATGTAIAAATLTPVTPPTATAIAQATGTAIAAATLTPVTPPTATAIAQATGTAIAAATLTPVTPATATAIAQATGTAITAATSTRAPGAPNAGSGGPPTESDSPSLSVPVAALVLIGAGGLFALAARRGRPIDRRPR